MNPGFDINKLLQEAHTRWLKPPEVLFILQNHERYPITPQVPKMPPQSGSLFLYNKRVLRNFRKDGHAWRKKRDGKTVGEAHEKLKVGNIDALTCYYAHGEQNPFFQRRSYWMLDPAYEHIVFVHYREVSEGRYISGPNSTLSAQSFPAFSQTASISNTELEGFTSGTSELQELHQNSNSPGSAEEISSWSATERFQTYHSDTMDNLGQPGMNQVLQSLTEQLSLDDADDVCIGEKLPAYPSQFETSENLESSDYETHNSLEISHERLLHDSSLELLPDDNERQQIQSAGSGYSTISTQSDQSPWKYMLELTSDEILKNEHDLRSLAERASLSGNLTSQKLDHGVTDPENFSDKNLISGSDISVQLSETRRFLLGSDTPKESPTSVSQFPVVEGLDTHGTGTLVVNSSDTTLGKENITDWLEDSDPPIENGIYSSELLDLWLDPSQFGISPGTDSSLTGAHNQRFTIREISPEWAFSSDCSKVIIIGKFLCNPSEIPWAVMFDDIEVSVEIVQDGVLRCQAPQHGAGKVTLCITSGNKESCSEMREFEFRADPNTSSFSGPSVQAEATKSADELLLLAKFADILFSGCNDALISEYGVQLEVYRSGDSQSNGNQWENNVGTFQVSFKFQSETLELDSILQELLKDKFYQWLMAKQKGKHGSDCLLSKQEQGIIHIISGLGFEWALNPILEFGVGINFRDISGWTALHWAARFGREKMVAALLAAGSLAGALTDPTPQDPIGKTPGAIAAANGHKGLAGYLSEVAITSHLSSLTMEENEICKGAAVLDAERAVESISQRSVQMHVDGIEDELSLKESLVAYRNSVQAAARIQAAFRAHSFRKRLEIDAALHESGLTAEDMHKIAAVSKIPRNVRCYDERFHKAALSIQKKYRGWKGRKDFLTFRQRVVKIQALVRGRQVRKKYNEILWTVGVVEKVILRWRRKGVGLRGFRGEQEMLDEAEDEDIVKAFRKLKVDVGLDQAVSRVLSMVESPHARQQYCRILEKYRQAKAEHANAAEAMARLKDDFEMLEKADYMFTY